MRSLSSLFIHFHCASFDDRMQTLHARLALLRLVVRLSESMGVDARRGSKSFAFLLEAFRHESCRIGVPTNYCISYNSCCNYPLPLHRTITRSNLSKNEVFHIRTSLLCTSTNSTESNLFTSSSIAAHKLFDSIATASSEGWSAYCRWSWQCRWQ